MFRTFALLPVAGHSPILIFPPPSTPLIANGTLAPMAPINAHALATVQSAQVVSHDERSILVEAGGFTPMRWFLEQNAQNYINGKDEERPAKRRKTCEVPTTNVPKTRTYSSADTIPLAQVTIDLHFPQTLAMKPPSKCLVDEDAIFNDTVGVPVVLYGIGDDLSGVRMRLAHPTAQGVVLKLELAELPKSVIADLRKIALPGSQKATLAGNQTLDYPASLTRCVLKRSMGELYCIVRLEASVSWRNGISAFPSIGANGVRRSYADNDMKAHLLLDAVREEAEHTQQLTPQDFYGSVHIPSRETQCGFGRVLEIDLYPFQNRAVNWMLQREGVKYKDERVVSLHNAELENTRFSFSDEVKDVAGKTCFVNHLRNSVSRERPDDRCSILGGLLAEEMGLGKTVELMALISLHKRPGSLIGKVWDVATQTEILPSKATLIVSPNSISPQWRSELGRHAPALKIMQYEGIPPATKRDQPENKILEDLTQNYDVILTTYHVLAREVHYAEDPPKRNLRAPPKFERKRSPLVQVQFWRTVMDEAQMIESSVNAAARVASRLPRVNAWVVTGTPLPKGDVQNLRGLLIFLRLKPFDKDTRLWTQLITEHRHIFKQIIGKFALRHTKAQIRDELRLPPQKRVVISIPFTAVEHQQYNSLFEQMREELAVDSNTSVLEGRRKITDIDDSSTMEKMRQWLTRLRQTCLHPEVGTHNRKALGRGHGPLRTVLEVLDVMIDQNETNTRIQERAALASELLRGHIVGNAGNDDERVKKALEIYRVALDTSTSLVTAARQRLDAAKVSALGPADASLESEGEDSSNEATAFLGALRNSLRTALQLQHVCTFFAATACYQIKVDENLTQPDSNGYKELDRQETELYEQAKVIRREILKDVTHKSEALMKQMRQLRDRRLLTKMPKIRELSGLGGIESRRVIDQSDAIFDIIREMGVIIENWRETMSSFLLKPLVDEDEDGNEITGGEYEESTKQQDELYAYFDALKAMQADLNTFVTGEAAPLIDHEVKYMSRLARRTLDPDDTDELLEPCHAPERLLELYAIRNKYSSHAAKIGSVRGLIVDARTLENSMQMQNSNGRAATESMILQQHIAALQSVFTAYTKALAGLDKEMGHFRSTQNQRIEFYRQLQELSDAVTPYRDELDEHLDLCALESVTAKEEEQKTALAQLRTKHRFLLHLRDESDTGSSVCVICQCTFENGVLTVCGHTFCKECIQIWWKTHHTCPLCKKKLITADFHNITYRPSEMRAKEETNDSLESLSKDCSSSSSSPIEESNIYTGVDRKLMDEIRMVDLPRSYSTKIDTLARHLHWIRKNDAGAKSIVFSQYRSFLDVLCDAFAEFKLGFSRLGRPGAVEKFRHDPSIDCMLLDAKSDSSGLTLVNATHVFICEPLIQTAVELQAIARVHRIGQTRQTTVWMYLINDTVEQSIYDISVARRMAHVQAHQQEHMTRKEGKSRSTTPGLGEMALQAADTEQLQSAPLSKLMAKGATGGEFVGKDDLWQCLFGRPVQESIGRMDDEMDADSASISSMAEVFGRGVRATAAEQRRNA